MAAISSSRSPEQIIAEMRESLNCPVYFEPMKDAVCLFPCMHKISEAAKKALLAQKCPLCREDIVDARPDLDIQNQVVRVQELEEQIKNGVNIAGKVHEMSEALTCYKGWLMDDAMCLSPCAHKISKKAYEIFKPQQCDQCNQKILSAKPDHAIQDQVQLFKELEKQIKASMPDDDSKEQALHYPGKSAVFKMTSDWTKIWSHDSVRIFEFQSSDPKSLIQSINVCGRVAGNITLIIVASDDCFWNSLSFQPLKDFLAVKGIKLDNYLDLFKIYDPQIVKRLFRVIAENNQFPEENLPLLNQLIENCENWKVVTPTDHVPLQSRFFYRGVDDGPGGADPFFSRRIYRF